MNTVLKNVKGWFFPTFYKPTQKKESHSKIPPDLLQQLKQLKHRAFIGAGCEQSKTSITKIWESIIRIEKSDLDVEFLETEVSAKAQIEELARQIDLHRRPDHLQGEILQLRPTENQKLLELQKKYRLQNEQLSNLEAKRGKVRARINALTTEKEDAPISMTQMDTKKAVIGSFVGMMLIEGAISYLAIERLGLFPSIGIIIFVLIYGGLIGTLCHLSGFYHSQNRKWLSIKSATAAYLLAISIIVLRTYAQSESYDWILNVINLLFVYACITISKRLHERREFWQMQQEDTNLTNQIGAIKADLKLHPLECKTVTDQTETEAKGKVQISLKNLHSRLAEQKKILAGMQARRQNALLRLEGYRAEGLAAIEQSYREGLQNQ